MKRIRVVTAGTLAVPAVDNSLDGINHLLQLGIVDHNLLNLRMPQIHRIANGMATVRSLSYGVAWS